ncbi:MAG: murein biosynthesis integral membrane protein MurJ [Streptosporangiales bacterium]|nr:murein biosynthesis integral membrane protein MurJ [Streptosporangiales bacterium]MBO0889988.1 murein biosynthesis integral membrane protein MurJ [Acidothermales bacterium]
MTVQESPEDEVAPPQDVGTGGLLRSSAVMAVGTLASRLTGFLRVTVIAAVLGSTALSNAYNTANNAPNSVYELFLGGVLSAVLVPLLVRADKRSRAEGELYGQRLLTLVLLVLVLLTVLVVAGAPLILDVIAGGMVEEQRAVAIAFLRYFLPQILFLGVGAVLIAILQARRRFAAPMWVPVLNNLTVIATGLLFVYVVDGQPTAETITPGETMLLGIGTTAGIVVQTFALVPSLLRAGFRPRLRVGFGSLGLGMIGRVGMWTIVYVATNLAQLFVVTNIGGAIDSRVEEVHSAVNYGYTPYLNAFTVFSLPHAIVAVSVITALLPRMSGHAADGRFGLVRDDLSVGIRLAAVLIVPSAVALIVLGRPIGLIIFRHGYYTAPNATYTGLVIAAFAVGLVPFSVFQLLLRVCFALQDTKTPALVNLVGTGVAVLVGIVCYLVLPYRAVMVALALTYGLNYVVNAVLTAVLLRRRLGGVDGRRIVGSLVRMIVAAVPGGVLGWLETIGVRGALGDSFAGALVSVLAGGVLVLGVFVALGRLLRVREMGAVMATFRGRLGR